MILAIPLDLAIGALVLVAWVQRRRRREARS
jgi:hypothetical protein